MAWCACINNSAIKGLTNVRKIVNALHFYSTCLTYFDHSTCFTTHTTFTHTLTYWLQSIGSNLGFSHVPKDTSTWGLVELRMEPLAWLVADKLYLLSHSRPKVLQIHITQSTAFICAVKWKAIVHVPDQLKTIKSFFTWALMCPFID